MDVTQIQVLTIDDVMSSHLQWLLITLPVIWAAAGGACIRLLLVRAEPFWMRSQNATAGVLLAVMLSDITAKLLTGGNYATGYAIIYGMVGRELFVTFYDFVNDNVRPLLMAALRHFFPFLFKDKPANEADNHDHS